MPARIEVPASYIAAVFGRYLTGQNDGRPPIAVYAGAGYGSITEGPPVFILRGVQPAWLGPRPIALAFTVRIPNPGPPP